jgi:pimeloyl-ACP methyl ester carboxylesterase
VTGKDEEYAFLRTEDRSWLEFYPDSTFVTVPGGHMLLVTNPEELACCIIENTGIRGSGV